MDSPQVSRPVVCLLKRTSTCLSPAVVLDAAAAGIAEILFCSPLFEKRLIPLIFFSLLLLP